jgi:hypothetical protein
VSLHTPDSRTFLPGFRHSGSPAARSPPQLCSVAEICVQKHFRETQKKWKRENRFVKIDLSFLKI